MTNEEEEKQKAQEETKGKEAEEATKKGEEEDNGESESSKTENRSPLEIASDLNKQTTASLAKMEKLTIRNEKLVAEAQITGKGFAGQAPPPEKTDDEKWAERAKERYKGTGMDPTPLPEESEKTKWI